MREVRVRHKGIVDYQETWDEMIRFTHQRDEQTLDEIWFLQHHPVYTQGTSCKETPALSGQHIKVVHSDRGGQMTYHGPGQMIIYLLLNLKNLNTGPKSLVNRLEQIVIEFLSQYGINTNRLAGAPGVYVDKAKIAALGLRISRGFCYHGMSINLDMDLRPFEWINPCGMEGLNVTQVKDFITDINFSDSEQSFEKKLLSDLDYSKIEI